MTLFINKDNYLHPAQRMHCVLLFIDNIGYADCLQGLVGEITDPNDPNIVPEQLVSIRAYYTMLLNIVGQRLVSHFAVVVSPLYPPPIVVNLLYLKYILFKNLLSETNACYWKKTKYSRGNITLYYPRQWKPSKNVLLNILIPHHCCNTIPPSIWFIESNVSWLCSIIIVINVNLSSNWCVIILINLLLFLKLVATFKIVNCSQGGRNTSLDLHVVLGWNKQDVTFALYNTENMFDNVLG